MQLGLEPATLWFAVKCFDHSAIVHPIKLLAWIMRSGLPTVYDSHCWEWTRWPIVLGRGEGWSHTTLLAKYLGFPSRISSPSLEKTQKESLHLRWWHLIYWKRETQGFSESLQHCIRPQNSVTSLYGRFRAEKLPYKAVTELWGLMQCCKVSAKPCTRLRWHSRTTHRANKAYSDAMVACYHVRMDACMLLGGNIQLVLTTHVLAFQDDELY